MNTIKQLPRACKTTVTNINSKCIFLMLLITGFIFSASAQNASLYSFSNVNTASLILEKNGNAVDMTTGTTQLVAAAQDDATSSLTNIGFNFTFFGTVYTNFTASSNGGIRMGGTISSTTIGNSFPISSQPILAPYLQDLRTSTTGKVHYKLIGSYPNRTLVVEFLNMGINYNNTTANGTFQARLYEQTNVIEYVYGAMSVGNTSGSPSANARTAVIGFSNTSGTNNQFSVNQTTYATSITNTAITNTNSVTGAITGLNSAADGSRRSFSFTPTLAYKSQFISMNLGSATWCSGETRNVSVTVKNIGTAAWTDAGPDVNIGVKWNTNGTSWSDYMVRVNAGNLAAGATQTYNFTITATNATGTTTPTYTTPLSAGNNNLTFDIVKESDCWFGANSGTCGPGNIVYASPVQTIIAQPTIIKGANPAVCQGVTTANLTYSATTGTPNQYSIVYDAAANLAGFVNVVNASLPASPIPMTVPGAVAAGTYNAILTVTNSTTGCTSTAAAIAVTVNGNSTLGFTSAAGTNAQTMCNNTAITNITYLVGGSGTGATVTGLPMGVTGAYNSGTKIFTISGTPTVSGPFSYTVTTNGPCGNTSLGGTIGVTVASSLTLVSAAGTTTQAICLGSSIVDINYTYGGTATGTSITAGALPAGVISGDDAGGNFTITGIATVSGTFSYTITTSGPCPMSLSGSITVNTNSTLSLTSAAGTDAQTKCISTAITNITYLVGGGGTGASATGLPTGVTGSYNSGTKVFTISGTPSVAGSFSYTVNTAGPCTNTSLGGTIDVIANSTISLTSGAGTNIQTRCNNSAISDITYSIGGTGTGAFVTGLPAGISGSFNAGVFTISGAASVAGTFNYTVTTSGPCVNPSLGGTITVNALPAVTVSALPATICIGSNSVITATNSGGTTNQVFSGTNTTSAAIPDWSSTGVTSTISLAAGTNTLAATDLLQVTLNITHNNDADLDIFLVDPSGTRAILLTSDNGGGGNNYTNTIFRTDAATLITSGSAPFTGTFRPEGTITTAPDRTGNSTGGTYTSIPAAALSSAPINGSWSLRVFDDGFGTSGTLTNWSLSISKPGAYSTVFSGPGSFGSVIPGGGATNASPSVSVTPPATGTHNYNATTTDALGCQSSTVVPVTIMVNANSTISLSSGIGTNVQTVCINNAITDITYEIGGSGTGATVSGLPAGVTGSFNAGVFTISGTTTVSGNYNYTVTATGPCVNPSLGGTITVNANSTISLSSAAATVAQTKCINTPIVNITYAIGGGGTGATVTGLPTGVTGNFNAGVFTISGSATQSGSFGYTVTTTGPCVNNSMIGTIDINPNATISLSSSVGTNTQTVCNNTAIIPISYTLGGGAAGATVSGLPTGVSGLFNAGVMTISGTPSVAGVFNYTVTTTGTCAQTSASGTITVNAPPTATFTKTNVSACGALPDGTITITPSGGTGPYSYSWTGVTGSGNPATTAFPNPGNVATISGLKIGFYNVTVTDAVGCQAVFNNIHIQYAFAAFVTNNGSISASCANTGSIILYANAGVQPYTFSLDGNNFSSNNTFTNLAAGQYTAYVKDGAGCVITKSIQVNAAAPIVVNPFVRGASSCSPDGSIEIYRTGGISPYLYSLDGINYQVNNKFLNLAAGNYTAYVKDSKGCTGSQAVTVTQGTALGVTVSKNNTSTCVNDGSIQVNPSGGFAPYTYSINGGSYQPGNSFSGLAAGIYTISVKDFKGCLGSRNVTINLNPIIVIYFVVNASSCVANNGSIHLFRTGGVGPYTYSLDGNTYQSGTVFNGLAPGTYDGFVKDSKTCVGATFNIVVGPACAPPVAGGTNARSLASSTAKNNAIKVSEKSILKISAYPNPSSSSFTLILDGGTNENVTVSVTDLLGRKVYQSTDGVKKQHHFGNELKAGIYILQVTQGNEKQSLKLIKE